MRLPLFVFCLPQLSLLELQLQWKLVSQEGTEKVRFVLRQAAESMRNVTTTQVACLDFVDNDFADPRYIAAGLQAMAKERASLRSALLLLLENYSTSRPLWLLLADWFDLGLNNRSLARDCQTHTEFILDHSPAAVQEMVRRRESELQDKSRAASPSRLGSTPPHSLLPAASWLLCLGETISHKGD